MAAANFYGFGRLAFDTALTAEEIAREWVRCTYGCNNRYVYGTWWKKSSNSSGQVFMSSYIEQFGSLYWET